MKESFLKDLLRQIITKEDLIVLLEEINLTENFIFKNINTHLSGKLKGKTREEFRNLVEKLEKENSLFRSPSEQFSFFQNLKKNLKKIPQLKLELAFEPSREFLIKIKEWFREKNQREVILDLSVNPDVVGGAIIEYQGKYRNLSVGKKIDEFFATAQNYD